MARHVIVPAAALLVALLMARRASAQGTFYTPPPACGTGLTNPDCSTNTAALGAAVAALPAFTALAAKIPVPLATVPPGPTPAGAAGTPGSYVPANAVQPSLSRSTTVTTASDGTFSLTWGTPLVSTTPVINLIPINTASQPAICNVTARSASGLAAKCWLLATQVLSALGATVNVSTGSAANMSVMVFAREPTQ